MKLIQCRPVRNTWLKALYENNLVEASERTRLFADKLYFYRELHSLMGEALLQYHPKTMGLREFILKHNLVNADGVADTSCIQAALKLEFSNEVILKPTAVINTSGENGLYLFSTESLLKAFADKNPELLQAALRSEPYVAPLLQTMASGEEFLLQEHLASIAGVTVVEKTKHYEEIRIHTYEDEVLRGASFSRWVDNEIKDARHFYWAQDFVQDFLMQLPPEFLHGQAWGLDLFVFENKVIRILEINTNRGTPGQWTGFLSRPELMGAYTRVIEKKKKVRFAGLSGFMLRKNLGNITKHLKKKYIEGIR